MTMTDRLHPFLPFDMEETPLSFAARLAAFHTRGPLVTFLNDMGIPVLDLIASKASALTRLAEVSGVPLEVLNRTAIVRIGERDLSLRGEVFTKEFLTGGRTLFCPLCLAEDDDLGSNPAAQRRHRLIWRLRPFRVCPDHGLHLLERRGRTWLDKTHDLSVLVPETGDALRRLAEICAPATEPSPLQAYLAHRLVGGSGPSWLDRQGVEQATLATELLGAVLAFGPKVALGALSPAQWTAAACAGYAVTGCGAERLAETLHEMVRVAQTGPGPLTPARAFGTLYARLNLKDSTKDPGPIKALVREVAFETMALGEGEVVLGELLKQRRFHTAASLARTHGLDTRTLRHLLVADGVISADRRASDDLPFDATTGDALAVRAKTAVPISALPYHLGCTRPQAQQIVAAGLLRPLVEDPAASHGILRCAVPRSDVEALLDALHARAPEIPSVPDETVSIAKAAEKTRRSSAEILRLLLEGDFPGAVRPKGTRGIKAIRISVDVLPVQIPAERPGIGVTAFFKDLGLSHAEGARLIALSTTVPLLRPVSDGGRTSRRARLRADDVQVFKTTYVTLSQLCRATGRHHQTVARSLFRAEVKPALDPKLLGFDLYRRADIPPKLFR